MENKFLLKLQKLCENNLLRNRFTKCYRQEISDRLTAALIQLFQDYGKSPTDFSYKTERQIAERIITDRWLKNEQSIKIDYLQKIKIDNTILDIFDCGLFWLSFLVGKHRTSKKLGKRLISYYQKNEEGLSMQDSNGDDRFCLVDVLEGKQIEEAKQRLFQHYQELGKFSCRTMQYLWCQDKDVITALKSYRMLDSYSGLLSDSCFNLKNFSGLSTQSLSKYRTIATWRYITLFSTINLELYPEVKTIYFDKCSDSAPFRNGGRERTESLKLECDKIIRLIQERASNPHGNHHSIMLHIALSLCSITILTWSQLGISDLKPSESDYKSWQEHLKMILKECVR
jgi:hypothetical protein